VAFLDADDCYLPGRFSVPAEVFAQHPGADGVYEAVGTCFQDAEARRRWRREGGGVLTTLRQPVAPSELFDVLLVGDRGHFCTDGIVVRRDIFRRTGPFAEDILCGEDTGMWLRMAAVGRLLPGRLSEPVALRRVHSSNLTAVSARRLAGFRFRLKGRLLAWGCRNELSDARVRRLLRDYHEQWCARAYGEGRVAGSVAFRKCVQLAVLFRIVLRVPGLLSRGLLAGYVAGLLTRPTGARR
jgi:hypothetical protein